ncbi:hypothetical protein HD554DRAFT_2041561 [Boletus coccyginus]|nr:hypothetical protein HD554DRAFT_2041561 [Boletus coccyginus]
MVVSVVVAVVLPMLVVPMVVSAMSSRRHSGGVPDAVAVVVLLMPSRRRGGGAADASVVVIVPVPAEISSRCRGGVGDAIAAVVLLIAHAITVLRWWWCYRWPRGVVVVPVVVRRRFHRGVAVVVMVLPVVIIAWWYRQTWHRRRRRRDGCRGGGVVNAIAFVLEERDNLRCKSQGSMRRRGNVRLNARWKQADGLPWWYPNLACVVADVLTVTNRGPSDNSNSIWVTMDVGPSDVVTQEQPKSVLGTRIVRVSIHPVVVVQSRR